MLIWLLALLWTAATCNASVAILNPANNSYIASNFFYTFTYLATGSQWSGILTATSATGAVYTSPDTSVTSSPGATSTNVYYPVPVSYVVRGLLRLRLTGTSKAPGQTDYSVLNVINAPALDSNTFNTQYVVLNTVVPVTFVVDPSATSITVALMTRSFNGTYGTYTPNSGSFSLTLPTDVLGSTSITANDRGVAGTGSGVTYSVVNPPQLVSPPPQSYIAAPAAGTVTINVTSATNTACIITSGTYNASAVWTKGSSVYFALAPIPVTKPTINISLKQNLGTAVYSINVLDAAPTIQGIAATYTQTQTISGSVSADSTATSISLILTSGGVTLLSTTITATSGVANFNLNDLRGTPFTVGTYVLTASDRGVVSPTISFSVTSNLVIVSPKVNGTIVPAGSDVQINYTGNSAAAGTLYFTSSTSGSGNAPATFGSSAPSYAGVTTIPAAYVTTGTLIYYISQDGTSSQIVSLNVVAVPVITGTVNGTAYAQNQAISITATGLSDGTATLTTTRSGVTTNKDYTVTGGTIGTVYFNNPPSLYAQLGDYQITLTQNTVASKPITFSVASAPTPSIDSPAPSQTVSISTSPLSVSYLSPPNFYQIISVTLSGPESDTRRTRRATITVTKSDNPSSDGTGTIVFDGGDAPTDPGTYQLQISQAQPNGEAKAIGDPIEFTLQVSAASPAGRKVKRKIKRQSRCPHPETDCATASGSFECVDIQSELTSCGGCNVDDTKPEFDCTLIKNAKGVGCDNGRCIVFSCLGFSLVPSEDKTNCVRRR